MKLSEQLKERQEQSLKKYPKLVTNQMSKATTNLKESGIEKSAKSTGDIFDNASLLNLESKSVDLYKILDGKPAIISFYRGSWCPYCNLELRAYEEILGKEENKDVHMIAISPEKPDVTTVEQDVSKLNFTVLSDIENKLAIKLRIIFSLPKPIQLLYGKSVTKSTGVKDYSLPLPATYVIDSDHKIVKAWVDADYTKRAEPSEVVAAYREVSK